MSRQAISAFILAKDERKNIGKCLESFQGHNIEVTLLDSSTTDGTSVVASDYPFVNVVKYHYSTHCNAYNEICTTLCGDSPFVVILDADMVVTSRLFREILALLKTPKTEVIQAPVLMYVEGQPLYHGSLYPPKAIVFKAGREYFVPMGHGEALMSDCAVLQTQAKLIHDDRKEYTVFLKSQIRYAQGLIGRAKAQSISMKDGLRMNTPVLFFLIPFISYIMKRGFLSGKAGLVYALDRLIAEAIMFRQSLAEQLKERHK